SSDFRDAWAVGFDDRYTVGIWLGNLDRSPSSGVSGAVGPALLLRSLFAALNRGRRTRPLPLAASLEQREVCVPLPMAHANASAGTAADGTAADGTERETCSQRGEWFAPGTAPAALQSGARPAGLDAGFELRQPTQGLRL